MHANPCVLCDPFRRHLLPDNLPCFQSVATFDRTRQQTFRSKSRRPTCNSQSEADESGGDFYSGQALSTVATPDSHLLWQERDGERSRLSAHSFRTSGITQPMRSRMKTRLPVLVASRSASMQAAARDA